VLACAKERGSVYIGINSGARKWTWDVCTKIRKHDSCISLAAFSCSAISRAKTQTAPPSQNKRGPFTTKENVMSVDLKEKKG
jgi:hypothetical protein